MKKISADTIYKKVKQKILEAVTVLRDDVIIAIKEALKKEKNKLAKEVLEQILKNAEIAKKYKLPLCQDTGIGVFFCEIGSEVEIEGGSLKNILTKAMIDAYKEGYFRNSMCDPLTRKNTGDNSPAMFHFDLIEGDSLKIYFMARGGGSENVCFSSMLLPSSGWRRIKKFVIDKIKLRGLNTCLPLVVGLGIGGSFEYVSTLAKKALFRPLGSPNPDPELDKMEKELLKEINDLNIGPMGFGGRTTCLGVHINKYPCHIATLPVAISIQCHSIRWRLIEF